MSVVREALPPEPVHLVGISLGATVAALTCLAEPDRWYRTWGTCGA